MYQMTIFDYLSKDEYVWEHFRDNYCTNQRAYMSFDKDGHYSNDAKADKVKACCFKDENTAHTLNDLQVCSYSNCPLIKYLKGSDNTAEHQSE